MSVLETLEICFEANLSGVTKQLDGLGAQLSGVSAQAMAAAASFRPVGAAMSAQLAGGIESGRAGVIAQGAAAVSGLLTALGAGAAGAASEGKSAAQGYAQAVKGGVPGAQSAGRQLSAGMAAGVRSGKSAVTSAVSAVVNAALSKMRSMLQIHSPSKVARGLGAYFGEGFADGITGSAALAQTAAGSLGGAALAGLPAVPEAEAPSAGMRSALEGAVLNALGGVEITIPLSVDGMKLGEASIRGINAVTRSAGRLLLNI